MKLESLFGRGVRAAAEFLEARQHVETNVYERRVFVGVDLLCSIALLVVTPMGPAQFWMFILAIVQFAKTNKDFTARSAAARKAELEAELERVIRGPKVKLRCAQKVEADARDNQILTATAPLLGLAGVVATSGFAGLTAAAIVGAVGSLVRWGLVWFYGVWRHSYRRVRPPHIEDSIVVDDELTQLISNNDVIEVAVLNAMYAGCNSFVEICRYIGRDPHHSLESGPVASALGQLTRSGAVRLDHTVKDRAAWILNGAVVIGNVKIVESKEA